MNPDRISVSLRGDLVDDVVAFRFLARDMQMVRQFLEEWQKRPPEKMIPWPTGNKAIVLGKDDDPIKLALWSAAVTWYGRCWLGGRRKGHADRVEIPPEHKEAHRYMLDQRRTVQAHADRGAPEFGEVRAQVTLPTNSIDKLVSRIADVIRPRDVEAALEAATYFETTFWSHHNAALSAIAANLARPESKARLLESARPDRPFRLT